MSWSKCILEEHPTGIVYRKSPTLYLPASCLHFENQREDQHKLSLRFRDQINLFIVNDAGNKSFVLFLCSWQIENAEKDWMGGKR